MSPNLATCACCEGKGGHPVHFNPGGWKLRPCALCKSTGKVVDGDENRPAADAALLVLRRKCASIHYGLDRPEVTKWEPGGKS